MSFRPPRSTRANPCRAPCPSSGLASNQKMRQTPSRASRGALLAHPAYPGTPRRKLPSPRTGISPTQKRQQIWVDAGGGDRIHDFLEQPAAAFTNFTCEHVYVRFDSLRKKNHSDLQGLKPLKETQ